MSTLFTSAPTWINRLFTSRTTAARRRNRRARPAVELLESHLAPATIAWVGDVDDRWATDEDAAHADNTNWAGDVLPTANDDLLFDDSAYSNLASLASTNNLLTSVQKISFAGSIKSFTLSGNGLTLTGLAGTAISNTSSMAQSVNMPLTLGGALSIDSSSTATTAGLFLGGALSGGAALMKTGGRLTLQADNSAFTGQIDVAAGTLVANHANALGSTGAGTTVRDGATLELAAAVTYAAEPLTLNGSGVPGDGGVGVGALFNTASSAIFPGPITLASNSSIGPGNSSGDVLTLSGGIGESGTGRTLRIDPAGAGPGAFSTLRLSGPATYTGLTTVSVSAFELQKTTMAGGLTLLGGLGFSGLGSIAGPVTNNNTLMPLGMVLDPGTSTYTPLPGVLETGDLTFGPGGTASGVTIGNTLGDGTPNSGYGQVRVTGTVDLTNNGGLQVLNWNPNTISTTPLQPLVLIANDGTDPIIGQFDRQEGATVFTGGQQFQVTYKGGDGNDFAYRPIISTRVTLTGSSASPVFGQPVTFTVTVQAQRLSAAPPVGQVVLLDNSIPLAIGELDATGSATFTVTNLPVGGNGLSLAYKGTINTRFDVSAFQSSTSDYLNLIVAAPTAVASVSTSPASSVAGQPVKINAVVAAAAPSAATPTGMVDFFDGTTYLGTRVLVNGAASLVTGLAAGVHSLSVVYHGDANFVAVASAPFTHNVTVTPETTSTTVVAVGAGAGREPEVKLYDAQTGTFLRSFMAYDQAFRGGVRVAVGDVNRDGTPDIITGAGSGAPDGHVKVFDGTTGAVLHSFGAYKGYNGGVWVAAGDVTGDGIADIVTGAEVNGHVKVFDGASGAEIRSFMAYEGYSGAARVAAADVTGDGIADIVTGADINGHVKVFDGASGAEIRSFMAYEGYPGAVNVAAGDIDGDGRADIITGADINGHVKVFDGDSDAVVRNFLAFDGFTGGVRVGSTDLDGDMLADILAGAGPGALPHVKGFSGATLAELDSFFAFESSFLGGVYVGGE